MASDSSAEILPHRKHGLLKDQVKVVKIKGSDRYEIAPIPDTLSFEKGFFVVLRACQLLVQKNDRLVLMGLAGPSGAGKTAFTEKILTFLPEVAVISMDNYNDSSRLIDGNFDDPRLTDFDTLLKNIQDLRSGKQAEVPIYDFKSSSRVGYRTLEVPSSRVVIIEGIYALSEKLRPLLDLRVSLTGGVHFDLVKRVLRDIQRAGQAPEEIIHQISETVYPMYKVYIEPDLQTAHIKIVNKFNPFSGFQNPTYILKSSRDVPVEQIKSVLSEDCVESSEETYDIYLLPPGEDSETCQSYLRMRNKDGKYNLMFEEWVKDPPFVISPRITFEVGVRLLGGLMALGYTIATILKRSSHVFCNDKVCVKIDWLEQLNRQYLQVQGRDRAVIKSVAEQLGLEGSYVPRTYIEQIQLEKLVNEVMAMPDDLKTKLSIDEDITSSPKTLSRASAERFAWKNKNFMRGLSHSYSNHGDKAVAELTGYPSSNIRFDGMRADSSATLATQGAIIQLSDKISMLSDRLDEFTSQVDELNNKLTGKRKYVNSHDITPQAAAEACNGSSYFISGLENGFLTGRISNSSSSSQLTKESPLIEEVSNISRSQRQVMHQLDSMTNLLRDNLQEMCFSSKRTGGKKLETSAMDSIGVPLIVTLALGVGGLGMFLLKRWHGHHN